MASAILKKSFRSRCLNAAFRGCSAWTLPQSENWFARACLDPQLWQARDKKPTTSFRRHLLTSLTPSFLMHVPQITLIALRPSTPLPLISRLFFGPLGTAFFGPVSADSFRFLNLFRCYNIDCAVTASNMWWIRAKGSCSCLASSASLRHTHYFFDGLSSVYAL